MKKKFIIRLIGIVLFTSSLFLSFFSYNQSQSINCIFPEKSSIGEVDVSGLTREQAKVRLMEIFEKPLQLSMNNSEMELPIAQSGYEFHYDEMVDHLRCESVTSVDMFWKYIWNNLDDDPINVDLRFANNEEILQQVIEQ